MCTYIGGQDLDQKGGKRNEELTETGREGEGFGGLEDILCGLDCEGAVD